MSIASEISRISGNVSDALDAIEDKGVAIPVGANSDDLATLIAQISGGGGAAITVSDTTDTHGGIIREITAVNISDTTAVAADVAQGKYFYTAAGVKTQGTASGGGGGLEYETGTWTTQEDIAKPTINFTKAHTVPPTYISFIDATGSGSITSNSNIGFEYIDWYRLIGGKVPSETTTNFAYGYAVGNYFNANLAITRSVTNFSKNSDDENDATSGYARYWVSNTGFKPYTNSTSRYWLAGRTYKWVAVWCSNI